MVGTTGLDNSEAPVQEHREGQTLLVRHGSWRGAEVGPVLALGSV